jgi:hypothetical protein
MKTCRRRNLEISEQGKVWWNHRDIFDAEMVRRSLLVDRPRGERNGNNRAGDKEVSG